MDPASLSAETAENYENYAEAVRYIDAVKPPRSQFANQSATAAEPQPSSINYDDYPLPAEVKDAIKYLTSKVSQMKSNIIDGSPGAIDKIKKLR